MHSTQKQIGYTLVELIVVIAILVILSTVGFVGYSQYSITSRDGARASDIKGIYEWLKIVQAQKGKAPNPDNALTIRNGSGTIHTLQGTVGESVRQTVGLESGWRDPQSAKPYTYSLYSDKKHFQLLAMFEQDGFQDKFAWDSPIAPSAYAESADLTPVTIGTKLWVVLDTETETPINEVLTGSTTLASLAASGATVVGSPVGTGSTTVMTPSMLVALSSPLTTDGSLSAPVVSLQEQLFGSWSAYTTGWTSNTCDPNAMTVVELDTTNFLTTLNIVAYPLVVPANTIYKFAPGTYQFPTVGTTSTVFLSQCSGVVWEDLATTVLNFPWWQWGGNPYQVSTNSMFADLTLNAGWVSGSYWYPFTVWVNSTLKNLVVTNPVGWGEVVGSYFGNVPRPALYENITANGSLYTPPN